MTKPSISIVIPAYNEEGNIRDSIQSVLDALGNRFESYEIIVVNDGSTDRTGPVLDAYAANNKNIRVIHHEKNKGMGMSLQDGFTAATKDYIGSYPGDNGVDTKSLAEMFDLVGQKDIVLYYIANPEFRPRSRQILSSTFVRIMNVLFALKIRYYNGHAIYRAPLIKKLTVATSGHAYLASVLVRLLKSGCTYVEIPAIQHERKTGTTKAFVFTNVVSVFVAVARLVLRVWFSRRA